MAELRYEDRSVRRVVIALDESEGSWQALEEAARLAAALHVELVGLFVEDVTFLDAAALPVTRTLGMTARGPLDMTPELMERAFRVHAGRLRSRLMETSARWGLQASFRSVRGIIAEAIEAELEQGDLVALGRTGRRRTNHTVVGSTAQAMAEHARCPVFLLAGPLKVGAPVMAIYEGSSRALELAAEISRCYGLGLRVVVLGDGDREDLRKQAMTWCAEHGTGATVSTIESSTDDKVFEAVSEQTAAAAVIDAEGPVMRRLGVKNLLPHIYGPVLVVR